MMPIEVLRLRTPTSNVPWTPPNLLGLAAWYSADEPLNTLVGGLLDTLYDKSGSGNHAAIYSGTTSNRAQIFPAALNGLPTWGYDTSARAAYFRATNANVLAAGNNRGGLSAFAVSATVSATSAAAAVTNLTTGTSDSAGRILLARGSTGTGVVYGGGRRLDADANQTVTNNANFGTGYLISGVINDYANSDSFVWVDGSAAGSTTSFQTAGNTSATNSQAFNIGATGANLTPFTGRTAEVVLVSTALGTSDRQKLEGYLAHKWGLAGSLPGGHPYKASPPMI